MKPHKNSIIDSLIFYILLLALVVSSFSILKQKNTINQLKKFKVQVSETETWNYSNFVLNSLWNGKAISYSELDDNNSTPNQNDTSIFLVFDDEYCESCLKAEILRIKKNSSAHKIGVLALPKCTREISILAQSDLKGITPLGICNSEPDFWSSQMEGLIVYLKITNNIVTGLLIVDESFSNQIDKWLEINNSE